MIFKAIYSNVHEKVEWVLTEDKRGMSPTDCDVRTVILADVSQVEIIRRDTAYELGQFLSNVWGEGYLAYYTDWKEYAKGIPEGLLDTDGNPIDLAEVAAQEEEEPDGMCTLVYVTSKHKEFYAIVNHAYLMNDDGKTIERIAP